MEIGYIKVHGKIAVDCRPVKNDILCVEVEQELLSLLLSECANLLCVMCIEDILAI